MKALFCSDPLRPSRVDPDFAADEAALAVEECPACTSPRRGKQAYCDDCGYMYPADSGSSIFAGGRSGNEIPYVPEWKLAAGIGFVEGKKLPAVAILEERAASA